MKQEHITCHVSCPGCRKDRTEENNGLASATKFYIAAVLAAVITMFFAKVAKSDEAPVATKDNHTYSACPAVSGPLAVDLVDSSKYGPQELQRFENIKATLMAPPRGLQ